MKKLLITIAGSLLMLVLVSCSTKPTTVPTVKSYGLDGGAPPAPTTIPSTIRVPILGQPPAPSITVSVPPPAQWGANGTPPVVVQSQPGNQGIAYSGSSIVPDDRMIVQTGQMSLVAENVTRAIDQIARLAQDSNGYVVSSNVYRDGERLRGSISIRVPAGDFGDIMKQIAALAVDVTSQTSSSQDVTEEYVDLTAQLNNLQATEQQLLVIMQKAEKVEDILSVEQELSNTRSQIDQTKGRMQYLEKTSATSLIDISLEQSTLQAQFTADRRFINSGETVRFTSQIAGGFAPYSYQWDFGDGKTSNDAAPSHVYRTSGHYTVSLTVTDDRGNTDTAKTSDYITVLPGWSAANVAGGAWNGLSSFGRVLVDIGIWLGVFSPVWIIIGGIIVWQVMRRRKTVS